MANNIPTPEAGEVNQQPIAHEARGRALISPLDTFDVNIQVDYPYSIQNQGVRPGWNVPDLAVVNESINTIQQNQSTRFVGPQFASMVKQAVNPRTSSPRWTTVPNMGQALYTESKVQIHFSVNLTTAAAPDTVNLAIFRDGQKISQIYSIGTNQPGVPVLASGSYVDIQPSLMTFHHYELRWKCGSSMLTAVDSNRTFQCSSLRAQ